MGPFKDCGIVINEHSVKESDKMLTILTKDNGKIKVIAKGAKKAKSKFLAPAQLFTYSDLVIYDGKNFNTLSQCDILESFHEVKGDYDKFIYASYMAEICNKSLLDCEKNEDIFELFLKSLYELKKNKIDNKLISQIFLFKFLMYSGFSPQLDNCTICHSNTSDLSFFSTDGAVCLNCKKEALEIVKISKACSYTISYIINSDLNKLFLFTVTEDVLNELFRCGNIFLKSHLDIYLKTKSMLP